MWFDKNLGRGNLRSWTRSYPFKLQSSLLLTVAFTCNVNASVEVNVMDTLQTEVRLLRLVLLSFLKRIFLSFRRYLVTFFLFRHCSLVYTRYHLLSVYRTSTCNRFLTSLINYAMCDLNIPIFVNLEKLCMKR